MSVLEVSRKMSSREQTAYDLGFHEGRNAALVHGQWEFGELEPMGQSVHCSVCGWGSDMVHKAMWLEYPGHQYCGNCGAKMDGEGGTDNGSIG